jgi:hypothetical protein
MDDRSHRTPLLEPDTADVETEPTKERLTDGDHRVPRLCLLDGFSRELEKSRGVHLGTLIALTGIRVRTANAVYEITVLDPFRCEVLIQGGTLFANAAKVTLAGASLGRSFLKVHCIWIGLQMELYAGDCTVVTSPVSSIEVLEETFPTGSFAA